MFSRQNRLPLPTLQRRCTFYNIAREHCEFIKAHSQKSKNEETDVNKQLSVDTYLTLKKGKHVKCSCCGSIMYKYGFTTYNKHVWNLVSNKEEVFCSQRIRCSNSNCPGKNTSGNNIVHIILPSDVIPREELYYFELEDLSTCHEELEQELEKRKCNRKTAGCNSLEKALRKNRKIQLLKARYGSSFQYFFKVYVISRKGCSLSEAFKKLKVFEQAAKLSSSLTSKDISGQSYFSQLSADFLKKTALGSPNILEKFCSYFVRNLSTLHVRTLPYSTNIITLQTEIKPP